MDYAMPVAWGQDRRGFWTRRKKTAFSLAVVVALMAGLAVAFKMFDQSIGNNVVRDASHFNYEIWKSEELAGDAEFRQTGGGIPVFTQTDGEGQPIETFPGDERLVDVKIVNTNVPNRDATFFVYVDAIGVTHCVGDVIDSTTGACTQGTEPVSATTSTGSPNPQWNVFVNFWSLNIDREKVVAGTATAPAGKAGLLNEDDHTGENLATQVAGTGNPEDSGNRQYEPTCESGIRQLIRSTACNLGTVRRAGATDAGGEATDQRFYIFGLEERDTNTDQSLYRGWTLTFTLVFQARVPAMPDPAPIGQT